MSEPSSGADRGEHTPVDPESIVEAMVSIDTELVLETLVEDDTEQDEGPATAEAAAAAGKEKEEALASIYQPNFSALTTESTAEENGADGGAEKEGGAPEEEVFGGERDAPTTASEEEPPVVFEQSKLGKNVVELECKSTASDGRCLVYIVGTAHVSQESCDEVKGVIQHVKPKVVFLELCASRVAILMHQKVKIPSLSEMISMARKKGMTPFGVIYSWFLARIASKMDISPGAEFRVASEEALACGARVMLGDRPVQVTLKRTWAAMGAWHKTKLIFAMIFQGFFLPKTKDINQMVEDMKDTDMITALVQEMGKSFPTLMETLVYERDLFMTAVLRGVAQNTSSVVAVVGKGHVQGISDNWEKDISLEELMTVPATKKWYSQPVVFWGAIAFGIGGLAVFAGFIFKQKPQIEKKN